MDTPPSENLRRFFDRIKSAGFFARLFAWRQILADGYDAFGEFQKLQSALSEMAEKQRMLGQELEHQSRETARLTQELAAERGQAQASADRILEREREISRLAEAQANSENEVLRLKGEMVALGSRNEELLKRIAEKENEAGGLIEVERTNQQAIAQLKADLSLSQSRFDELNSRFIESQKNLTELRTNEEDRIRAYKKDVVELNAIRQQVETERQIEKSKREAEIRSEFIEMEQTWKKHEALVEQLVRSICQRHTIPYCDKEKFPYAGKPDNAVLIAEQYIIFDAKSPKNPEELSNFRQYIRTQADSVKKYIKGENVKKEIFLVVPANTVEYLDEFYLNMADYHVYVVTQDCLEPIILALKKIEEYEFVDQLSPEDRESICRVIGKFAHATKRRIQIDNYFSNEFIRLLQSCSQLPPEFLNHVVEFEKAEKMNPPMDRRQKLIQSIPDLEKNVKAAGRDAEAHEIDVKAVTKEKIETIPLDKYLE